MNKTADQKSVFHIYQGSPQTRHLASRIMELLRKCIHSGGDIRFRDISEIYEAFDRKICLYALNHAQKIIGFVYIGNFNVAQNKKPFVSIFSLMTDPDYRDLGLGKKLKLGAHKLARKRFPDLDLVSVSSNPKVIHVNQREEFREINYRDTWEIYGFDIIEDCKNYQHLSVRFKRNKTSSNLFENVEIIDDIHGCPKRVFVREGKKSKAT